MQESEITIQVLYEIAMSIGNSLDLKKMLQKSLTTCLRKFNLDACAVVQGKSADKAVWLAPVYAIPRRIDKNEAFQAALRNIPEKIPEDRLEENLQRLPLTGRHGSMFYHIMALPGFGLLIFLRSRAPLEAHMINTLTPLNQKLAVACRACLRKERIQKMAVDLNRQDIERQKAETALKESHERLVTILNSIDALIYVADINTHEMIFFNWPMENLFGSHALQKPCFEVFRAEDEPCPQCANDTLMDSEGHPTGVVIWEDRNPVTGRWYIHHARAVKWMDGRWVRLQMSTDITKFKKMEQERIRDAHLQQTQRLEALGVLSGGIAHEFNNLLMAMLGNLSLIKFKIDESYPFYRHLNKIEESIRLAANLTDQLLGYARKGRHENINLQLNTMIQSSVSEFLKTHESVKVRMDLSKELHQIEADQRQIELVLWNLFSNAADAMPDGGDIFIQTGNVKRQDLRGKPYRLPVENYVELRIKDTGSGMSPEVRERIFDPFYTTKPMAVGRGAGLGLAATYGIIKSHNGFIDVISEERQGSEFIVYFPAITDAPGRLRAPAKGLSAPKTILLIDDEKLALEIGSQILKHLGYRVIEASSGMEAIALYNRSHNEIDVVLLDLIMPDMTGIETFEQIRADFPEAKILLASGYILDAEARRLLEQGADGFVKKPFSIEELYKTIEKVAKK